VADRAGEANRTEASVGVECSLHTHYCVELEQSECRRRIFKVYFSFLDPVDDCGRKRLGVHFETDGEGCFRTYAFADASKLRPSSA